MMADWSVMFYHAHKIRYIPIVDPGAHCFHHHLYAATSFKCAMFFVLQFSPPFNLSNQCSNKCFLVFAFLCIIEEWLILVADVLMMGLLGISSASPNSSALAVSWYNGASNPGLPIQLMMAKIFTSISTQSTWRTWLLCTYIIYLQGLPCMVK